MEYSVSPDGEQFGIPEPEDYRREFERLEGLVLARREQGREIVVVMGLGFVGAVMAGCGGRLRGPARRQAHQVRHRHAAAEHAQLLENPAAQPGHLARSRPRTRRWPP